MTRNRSNLKNKRINLIFDEGKWYLWHHGEVCQYGFNRSHSAAYSCCCLPELLEEANYPAEYMASVLTHNMSNIEKSSFFWMECKRQEHPTNTRPRNESGMYFDVNKRGKIHFKAWSYQRNWQTAVESILMERIWNGPYTDIFSLLKSEFENYK